MSAVTQKYGVNLDGYATEALTGAVVALFRGQDIQRGIKLAEILVAEYPENVRGHFFLANGYGNSGKRDKALSHVNIAIELVEADSEQTQQSAGLLGILKRMQSQLSGS